MSDELVIRHCAPTLACIKTANLFSCIFADQQEMVDHVRRLNLRLKGKGLRILPLCFKDNRGLIYVYRPGMLSKDLQNEFAGHLLKKCGYSCIDENACLRKLIERLNLLSDFPHEIGLFLGYPPEDVKGFIKFRGRNSKTSGYWKVYGDVNRARKQFDRFSKCTGVYLKCLERGLPIAKLAVRTQVTA